MPRKLTQAKDLKVRMIAYLPYFGELRRAKIVGIHPYAAPPNTGNRYVAVEYHIFDKHMGYMTNRCDMKETSKYPVYVRPKRRT